MKYIFRNNAVGCIVAILLLMLGSGCARTDTNQVNENLIRAYYTCYEQKDSLKLCSILDKDFTFGSPVDVPNIDLKTYMSKCWPNAYNTKRFDIEKIMVDGDGGFVTYNGYTNSGELFSNTEYFKFKDGKILENVCYFGPGKNFPDNTKK